jgi:hypothetical protein
MRVAMRMAFGFAAFLLVAGVVYYASSQEWRGSVMLIVLAISFLYVALVFRGALRRASAAATPQAMAEEELEAVVGPTIWPFVISVAAILVVVGAVVVRWVLIPGAILLIGSAAGWFGDIRQQWRPGVAHAASIGHTGSAAKGKEHADEADRE